MYVGTKTILNNSVLRPGYGSPGKTLRGCLIPPELGEGLPGRLQAFLVLCAWLLGQTLSNWQVDSGRTRSILEPCCTLTPTPSPSGAPQSLAAHRMYMHGLGHCHCTD